MQSIFKLRGSGHWEACVLYVTVLHQCFQYRMLHSKIYPCVWWQKCFQQSQQAFLVCILPGSCRGHGPASFTTSLVCSFPHLVLETVFKLVLDWVGLNLCLSLALHLVDPDSQANALTWARVMPVQMCNLSVACLCLLPLKTNHQITASYWWWARMRKISCKLLLLLLETTLWKEDQLLLVYFLVTFHFLF